MSEPKPATQLEQARAALSACGVPFSEGSSNSGWVSLSIDNAIRKSPDQNLRALFVSYALFDEQGTLVAANIACGPKVSVESSATMP